MSQFLIIYFSYPEIKISKSENLAIKTVVLFILVLKTWVVKYSIALVVLILWGKISKN